MPEAQETLKESTTPMVELDTSGNAVDVEFEDPKANTKEVETKEKNNPAIKNEIININIVLSIFFHQL